MSVSILMYKVKRLNEAELRKINNVDIYDLGGIDDWEIKADPIEELDNHPARFEQIKMFMRAADLAVTSTDIRACAVKHGMPANVRGFGYSGRRDREITVTYADGRNTRRFIYLSETDMAEFTTTTIKSFGVVKYQRLDVDIDGWLAKSLMTALEDAMSKDKSVDLSYAPIYLNESNCEMIFKALANLYDKDEIYPNEDLARFLMELMRIKYQSEDDVFIEFQD